MKPPKARNPRTCVGCRERVDREEMIRWIPCPDTGVPLPDWSGRSAGLGGRGAWTHARPECIRASLRGGMARAWRTRVPDVDPDTLVKEALQAGERRWHARLGLAQRAGAVRVGQQALRERGAMASEHLLVVAENAGDAGRQRVLRNAERKGMWVVHHGDGTTLGSALGREFVSMAIVCAEPFRKDLRDLARALSSFPGEAGLRLDGGRVDETVEGGFCAPEELDAGAISAR